MKVRRLAPRPSIHDALFEHTRLIWRGIDIGEEGYSNSYFGEQTALRERVMAALAHEADVRALRRAVSTAEDPSRSLQIAVAACLFSPFWVRRPRDWEPRGTVPLLDHLFCYHPVPRFLCHPWHSVDAMLSTDYGERESDLKWCCWFILLGWGASLKMAARRFQWSIPQGFLTNLLEAYPLGDVQAPTKVDRHDGEGPRSAEEIWFGSRVSNGDVPYPRAACLHAEINRLGGDETDFRRISSVRTFLIDPTGLIWYRQEFSAFWQATTRWMIRHRDAITDENSPQVLHWAYHEFTESVQRRYRNWSNLTPRECELRISEERLFSWAGRRPASVLTLSRRYLELCQGKSNLEYRWPARGWDWQTTSADGTVWAFHELTTGEELANEGRALHHCVNSYAPRCVAGHSVIVSLRQSGNPCVTVEVDPSGLAVVQARGTGNREPTSLELGTIRRWEDEVLRRKN